jgi:ribosomal protein L40E
MTARNLIIFLALALVAMCGLALACPQAYGQMATIPKYDPTVTLDPDSPAPGTSVHVSYFYFRQGADPSVPNVYVRYSLTGPSDEVPLSSADGYTNAQGYSYADITIPSSPGDYTVNVYVYDIPGGEIWGQGAARFTAKAAAATPVAVTPSPTDVVVPTTVPATGGGFSLGGTETLLIIGAIIVVVILLIVVLLAALALLWTRRNLVVAPAAVSAPCDGTSAIPIRVRFMNGLGRARRMKEDTAVEMSATAGSISNAVIARGADFAETALTTSKEFGTVTITAKSGKMIATAKVRFTNDKARLGLIMTPDTLPADGSSSATVSIRVIDANGNAIVPMEGLAIDLKTTLGKVTDTAIIPAKAVEAKASFTAGTVIGNATITAAAGPLKGEATLAIREKPRRFCMHCGSPMEMEAPSCPKCGMAPPSGVDVKQCPKCGTVIPEAAQFCHKCGALQLDVVKAVDPSAVKK